MKVLAVCGMPGCGKGELAEIARAIHIPVFSMGDVVRLHFRHDHPDTDPIETGMYADMERKKFGQGVWAKRLVDMVEAGIGPKDEIVLIDGLRSSDEKELFRSRWGDDFSVLAIHSSPDTRFQRLKNRGRGDDSADRKVFDQRDRRELSWGLGEVIALSDMVLVNEGDLEGFRKGSLKLLEEVV